MRTSWNIPFHVRCSNQCIVDLVLAWHPLERLTSGIVDMFSALGGECRVEPAESAVRHLTSEIDTPVANGQGLKVGQVQLDAGQIGLNGVPWVE
jgi:hypothetical protein